MAKKTSSHRQRPASNAKGGATSKTQAASRQTSTATLVFPTKPGGGEPDSTAPTTPTSGAQVSSTPSPSSVVRDMPAASTKNAPKAATPAKQATKAPAPTAKAPAPAAATKPAPAPAASKRQDTRVARARATQRARQAGMISAENYSYVLGDLKLVAWLAGGALAILIALTFILPR